MTTAPFQLTSEPALARSEVDRGEPLRADAERLRSRWPFAQVVALDSRGRTPVRDGKLALRDAKSLADEPVDGAVYLGADGDVDYWAVFDVAVDGETVQAPGRWGVLTDQLVADGEAWVGLREQGDLLDAAGAGLFTTALALRNWQRRSRFCARCGSPTTLNSSGWASYCEVCEREEYPRTDPAVICLVHDDVGVNGEKVLLARGAQWPEWARSVLAGFVEAGESLEACVRREIAEEVGLDVSGVRYLGSQPWPFPRSVMLAFAARADRSAPLVLADGEIAAAEWYTRQDVLDGFERGLEGELRPGELRLPGNASIASTMLESWAVSDV